MRPRQLMWWLIYAASKQLANAKDLTTTSKILLIVITILAAALVAIIFGV